MVVGARHVFRLGIPRRWRRGGGLYTTQPGMGLGVAGGFIRVALGRGLRWCCHLGGRRWGRVGGTLAMKLPVARGVLMDGEDASRH